ncbi:hypothetical protein [Paenibacillus sinopodophylli]|uniref:hypothetical protein n=1 Tax=Paenibacillus sinopodophylli TaxID=1837342 RepID=UPI00110CD23B|nr:hypothetical protein [Paenibacillus sinopodophylli]
MTHTVSAIAEPMIDVFSMLSLVPVHKLVTVSDDWTSSMPRVRDAMLDAACLSATIVCDQPNNINAGGNRVVQVSAAMKKA